MCLGMDVLGVDVFGVGCVGGVCSSDSDEDAAHPQLTHTRLLLVNLCRPRGV